MQIPAVIASYSAWLGQEKIFVLYGPFDSTLTVRERGALREQNDEGRHDGTQVSARSSLDWKWPPTCHGVFAFLDASYRTRACAALCTACLGSTDAFV